MESTRPAIRRQESLSYVPGFTAFGIAGESRARVGGAPGWCDQLSVRGAHTTPIPSPPPRSLRRISPPLLAAGVVVHGMVNAMRRRPLSYGASSGGRRARRGRLARELHTGSHCSVMQPSLTPPPATRPHPRTAEPWWHVINAAAGGVMLNWVAHKYDGTAAFMEKQMGSYSKLPTWAYGALNDEELGAWRARRSPEEGARGG